MRTKLISLCLLGAISAATLAGCAGESDADKAEAAVIAAGGPAMPVDGGTRAESKAEAANRGWVRPKALTREDYERKAKANDENPAHE